VASYKVILTSQATKEFAAIGRRSDRERIMDRIRKLAINPRPPGSKKLKGPNERYRVRQGNYRILYEIRDQLLVVTVIHVGDRKDVYRRGRA
jgi:mRNA interferase RelE/StbE